MPATKKKKQEKQEGLKTKIKEQVIALLGNPPNLYKFDIKLLWSGRARVNIWRTVDIKPEQEKGVRGAIGEPSLIKRTVITDSFFLRLSKTGIIECANPEIERKY